MPVEITEVKSRKQLRNFIQFTNKLYKEDPNYVPVLYLSEEWTLSKKKHF